MVLFLLFFLSSSSFHQCHHLVGYLYTGIDPLLISLLQHLSCLYLLHQAITLAWIIVSGSSLSKLSSSRLILLTFSVLTLLCVGTKFILCWFSLNNLEKMKGITLGFYIIQYLFIKNTRAKFAILNFPQSSDIGKNSDRDIFNFWISGQSFINKNCHNSRTSHDIDMKFRPVTKLDKRNKAT